MRYNVQAQLVEVRSEVLVVGMGNLSDSPSISLLNVQPSTPILVCSVTQPAIVKDRN